MDIRVAAEQARVALSRIKREHWTHWGDADLFIVNTALASLEAALAAQPEQQQGLVAASPAAAAGVPTGWKLVPVEPTWEMERAGQVECDECRTGCRGVCRKAARSDSGQGCELATDATKQPPNVRNYGAADWDHEAAAKYLLQDHLAAPQNDQDFRMRPASSEAAPSASLGLVERLRNGGQTDLADMAGGLLSALELLISLNMDQDDTTLAAIERANAAIAAATGA